MSKTIEETPLKPRTSLVAHAAALVIALGCRTMAGDEAQSANSSSFFKRNVRFAVDVAARGAYEASSREPMSALFAGVDLQKVFSGDEGDIGTLLIQGYVIRIDNVADHPGFFSDDDDTAFEFRNLYFNYTGLVGNRLNLKIGHFELPYGLEATIDTNGTLRDYTLAANVGVKADWGVTVNGALSRLEYEVGISRGSGNNWTSAAGPYAVVGRVGSSRSAALVAGLSGFSGRVVAPDRPEGVIERSRLGVDGQWTRGFSALLAEVSLGREDHRSFLHALAEADFTRPESGLLGYSQIILTRAEAGDARRRLTARLVLGAAFEPEAHWSFSLQWSRDLKLPHASPKGSALALQIRHR